MPIAIPRTVRDTLGEDASEDLARWFEEVLHDRTVPLTEYRQDMAEVKTRLSTLEQGHSELRSEINDGFRQMNGRIDSMIKWMVGTVALFGTLITALLAIAQFTS